MISKSKVVFLVTYEGYHVRNVEKIKWGQVEKKKDDSLGHLFFQQVIVPRPRWRTPSAMRLRKEARVLNIDIDEYLYSLLLRNSERVLGL